MRSAPLDSQSLAEQLAGARAAAAHPSTAQRRRVAQQALLLLLVLPGAILFLIPWVWMLMTAGKSTQEIWRVPAVWIPETYLWQNYIEAWQKGNFITFYRNTALVSGLNVLAVVLSCSVAAYAFARIQFPGRNGLFLLVLSTMMLPAQVTLIPLFMIFSKLGWVNTLRPLVVPLFFGDAFSIFLLRQFMLTIPRDYDEAALIDGCSRFGVFWRILLPQIRPALIVVAIYQFTWSWNDFFGPLIYLNSPHLFTVTLGLSRFMGRTQTDIQYLMAMTVVSTLAPILIFFLTQRIFLQGIVISGVKG
ncbi:MAG TPA: carbohydrate ABC transporter permease [Caldilineaceae bacterium]|nr:carbohydrate ABC transporter permease [Caldilineaceae bacterium]